MIKMKQQQDSALKQKGKTVVRMSIEVRDALNNIGERNETYDDILRRLINEHLNNNNKEKKR